MSKYKGPTADPEADAMAYGEDMDREESRREYWREIADALIAKCVNELTEKGKAVLPDFASDDKREMGLAEMCIILDEDGYNECVAEYVTGLLPHAQDDKTSAEIQDEFRQRLIMTLTDALSYEADEWIEDKVDREKGPDDDDYDGPGDDVQDDPYFEMP